MTAAIPSGANSMRELPVLVPTVDLLLDLAPEELGGKLLFSLRSRYANSTGMDALFTPSLLPNELWRGEYFQADPYPRDRSGEINMALLEAFAWLEAQGLIIQAPGQASSFRILTRRARSFADETEFANYEVARRLPKAVLHARIAYRTWASFMRGDYDGAVFHAMKTVEVAVREASGIDQDGVALMRSAFHPDRGPLRDPAADGGERSARMDLFAGAIGSFKNPQSHRDVNLDDPQEAIEIIMLANRLLRIVDARLTAGRVS